MKRSEKSLLILAFFSLLGILIIALSIVGVRNRNLARSMEEETPVYSGRIGYVAPKTDRSTKPKSRVYASAEAGKALYDINCKVCHQEGGTGKPGFAPFIKNRDFLTLASNEFLHQSIKAGRPGTAMVPWSHLTTRDIDSIIAYLRSGEKVKTNTRITRADPEKKFHGNAESGKSLYGVYCSSCHGTKASGYAEGGSGPGIGNPGFLAVASDDYIFQTVKHGRAGTSMRSFVGAEGLANLSEDEVADIIAFLRKGDFGSSEPETTVTDAGDPKAGEMHFNANCSACHQANGLGKPGVAPSIRNRDFLSLASDEFIRKTVTQGRPGTTMIQRPDLDGQPIKDIIAYLRTIPVKNKVDIKVDPTVDHASLGSAEEGTEKYAVYCASCHGPEGKGYIAGGSGPAIGLPGFLSTASDDYIYQTLKLGRIGTAMRPFIGAAGLANLSTKDAQDIIAYLRRQGGAE